MSRDYIIIQSPNMSHKMTLWTDGLWQPHKYKVAACYYYILLQFTSDDKGLTIQNTDELKDYHIYIKISFLSRCQWVKQVMQFKQFYTGNMWLCYFSLAICFSRWFIMSPLWDAMRLPEDIILVHNCFISQHNSSNGYDIDL